MTKYNIHIYIKYEYEYYTKLWQVLGGGEVSNRHYLSAPIAAITIDYCTTYYYVARLCTTIYRNQ